MQCVLPQGYRLYAHATLDSTNDEARRLAAEGEPGGAVIAAKRQTAGRGRQGREWVSPPGNLMASLLLRPECSPAKAGQLSFVMGLAVMESLEACGIPSCALALKWPNDVLLGGRKVAGILLESDLSGKRIGAVILGVGINIAQFPLDTPYPATSIKAQGFDNSVENVLEQLVSAFDAGFCRWQREGLAPAVATLRACMRGIGERIQVRLPSETLEGRFEALTDDGAVRLRLDTGEARLITAGEVFF